MWEQRPAVFVFNHQSQLDVFVICYLLRRDFTGVAKQELTKDPIFGPVFKFAGVAFVDRQGGGNPRDALAPAVAKLDEGISVVIAPEGTRSLTPTLGEFKTGAFHLAREAGVPVVPIVIRNAGELMWRDSLTIKPGTVQVAVLPPIDVSAWPADQVRNKTREVQAMFADTLAHWPGDPRPAPKDPAPPKKTAAKKAAPRKAAAKKTATKKAAPKKAAAKKTVTKRSTRDAPSLTLLSVPAQRGASGAAGEPGVAQVEVGDVAHVAHGLLPSRAGPPRASPASRPRGLRPRR